MASTPKPHDSLAEVSVKGAFLRSASTFRDFIRSVDLEHERTSDAIYSCAFYTAAIPASFVSRKADTCSMYRWLARGPLGAFTY
jgi:hypothetical protein